MRGVLLDPLTGTPDGDVSTPSIGDDVERWLHDLNRKQAERRNRDLLDRARTSPIRATTTTLQYKCHPTAAAGISRASSGSTAWSNSAYTELVAVNTITSTYYIAGFTWCWHTPIAGADTTYEIEFDIATGAAASEVVIITIPSSFRADTAVGYVPSNFIAFAEPKQVAANTRLSIRVRQSLATTSQTYTGIKILYQV